MNDTTIQNVPVREIGTSPLNPRSHIDKTTIAGTVAVHRVERRAAEPRCAAGEKAEERQTL